MRLFMQVASPETSKTTSSWLKKAIGFGIKFLVGADAFKKSYETAPDTRSAIALVLGLTPAQVDTQLRLNGHDPSTYYDHLASVLGDNISNKSEEEINSAMGAADEKSKDPSQLNWLWAAGGLLLVLGIGGKGKRYRTRTRVVNRYRKPRRKRRRGRW